MHQILNNYEVIRCIKKAWNKPTLDPVVFGIKHQMCLFLMIVIPMKKVVKRFLGKQFMDLSIIIPVYNAEKYLEKCLLSIQNQLLQNFEVIMVNDGSLDNSEIICRNFAKKTRGFVY